MLDTMHGVTGMKASNVYVKYSTLTTSIDSSLDWPLLPLAFFQGCASVPLIAAAAWFTCDTTLLDLPGGVLALGAGKLFPRHMARAFGVALVCALYMEHRSLGSGRTAPPPALMLFASADYLLYFWCMPELPVSFKPNSFLAPCSSTAENSCPVFPKGYVFTVVWGLHTVHHGLTQ